MSIIYGTMKIFKRVFMASCLLAPYLTAARYILALPNNIGSLPKQLAGSKVGFRVLNSICEGVTSSAHWSSLH